MKKTKVIICDIDGVLMDGPWWDDIEDFYLNMGSWYPIDWTVYMVNCFYKLGYKIIFLTARDEKVRVKTTQQLKELFSFNINLYMRPRGDMRESYIVKEEHLMELMEKYDILFAMDDEIPNCQMFKKHGIPVVQITL